MSDVQTLEGWYALHDFRTVDWGAWKSVSASKRQEAIAEWQSLIEDWNQTTEDHEGSTGLFTVVGHKADLLTVHFRPTLRELDELETAFNKTAFADYTTRPYSYVSVVELSNYLSSPDADPENDPRIQARLKPEIPDYDHICFYPMNKRRQGEDNWYMLSMEERKNMMRSHGMIGRKYAGHLKQIITGSVGLDDWEWGVSLFSDDPVTFKKLVYEMRFDEVSARYGDFGDFYIGNRLHSEQLPRLLSV